MAKPTTPPPQETGRLGSGPIARARAAATAKEGGSRSGPGGAASGTPSVGSFYRESLSELRKVTWPTRQEAVNLTIAVIGMTVAMAIFLGLIDGGLDRIVNKLLGA